MNLLAPQVELSATHILSEQLTNYTLNVPWYIVPLLHI